VVGSIVRIDIWSDVICPWCYLGSRRLDAALDRLGRDDVEIRWHAFQLDPGAPPGSQDLRAALERKYGSGSFDAHRLLAWAATRPGGQGPLVERLFLAYFTEGADVSDHTTLCGLVAEVGGDADAAAAVLTGPEFGDEVRADVAAARERDVTGVPAFVVDDGVMIPGAQDVDTFVRVLERTAARGNN
jgi:predicted DsbA family dithiol-disulfide isomerase